MHYLENSKEWQDICNNYPSLKPFEILENNFEGTNTILAHCVKLSDDDFRVLRNLNLIDFNLDDEQLLLQYKKYSRN